MEEENLKVIGRYSEYKKGDRVCDYLADAFAELVNAMEETNADILADLYIAGVAFGENRRYYAPEHVCNLMDQYSHANW